MYMPNAGKLKVLVVEDDLLFNQFYTMFLEMKDAVCVSCFTVEEARHILESDISEQFDVIILDNHLTDGEGLTILPLIKQRCKGAAVVMVSGNDDTDFFLRAFAEGIDDYAVKPINMDLLWVKITRSVAQYRLAAANAQQQRELEIWVSEEQKEQELARFIFHNMTKQMLQQVSFIQTKIQPSALFSGDVVLYRQGYDGSWYVLLADSMGHGLAAAVALMPIMELFESMSSRALPLSNLVFELNRKLARQLPDDRFVAAAILKINPLSDLIEVWNGGMPPVMLFDADGNLRQSVRSSNMALGILSDDLIEVTTKKVTLHEIDRILMFSDGAVETVISATGEMLTYTDIENIYAQNADQGFGNLLATLADCADAVDDISACEVHCAPLLQQLVTSAREPCQKQGIFSCEMTLSGRCLNDINPPTELVELLLHLAVPQELCNKTYAILTELFQNSFEHGVLQLNSEIKQQEDGFFAFYQLKEERSENLTATDSIRICLEWNACSSELTLEIFDSGQGFVSQSSLAQEHQHYGRGLSMVANLASSLTVVAPGNHIKVVING
jgi:response regulator of citrate/malate metabolism